MRSLEHMSDYPEHDKILSLQGKNETVATFLEWLQTKNYVLCEWREEGNNGQPQYFQITQEEKDELKQRLVKSQISVYAYEKLLTVGRENPSYDSWSSGHYPIHKTIEVLLADYFEIDLKKFSAEKEAIYQTLKEGK